MDQKISVVINTYNAERHISRVLESLKNFDEIVVCDMESTDSTLDIARQYGCKIVTFPKGDNKICEPARDFAIHSATNEWVLVIDSDELVTDELRSYLYNTISKGKYDYALAIPRINRFLGSEITSTPDYQLRFFKKSKAYWPPVIHARPVIDGKIKKIPAKKELSLQHLDDSTIADRIKKINIYTDYEIPKRAHKKYGICKMIVRPFWFFLKNFLFGGGFRDGKRGLINAYMAATYQIVLLSKHTESKYKQSRQG